MEPLIDIPDAALSSKPEGLKIRIPKRRKLKLKSNFPLMPVFAWDGDNELMLMYLLIRRCVAPV